MDASTKKFFAKVALSIVFATILGYAVKLERKIEDGIDEHYNSIAS